MNNSRTVYSTDKGRLCPECRHPAVDCQCGNKAREVIQGNGKIRVSRETKGRKGKGVTLVSGLPLPEDGLKLMAGRMKQFCGTGGTVKNGIIEIQGDHRERLLLWLQQQGHAAKIAGG